jgi:hypothetical protein
LKVHLLEIGIERFLQFYCFVALHKLFAWK